jgi:hypothetical protein
MAKLAWETHPVDQLMSDGREYTLHKDQEFWVAHPLDHRAIYRCNMEGIATTIIPIDIPNDVYNTADFDSHVNKQEFTRLTGVADHPEIAAWEPTPKVYHNGDYVQVGSDYSRYYKCILEQVSQVVFSIYEDGGYPINPDNGGEEKVVSGIRNEGWYLFPRGSHADLQWVPKYAGMIYLDTSNRRLYVYTDGLGQPSDYGWYPYTYAAPPVANVIIGSRIGWGWTSSSDPRPAGWLLCDGSLLDNSVYSDLYAVIGNSYRLLSDPVGTFRVPTADDFIIYSGVI